MGKICKYANLYDSSGKLIEKAPIKTKVLRVSLYHTSTQAVRFIGNRIQSRR